MWARFKSFFFVCLGLLMPFALMVNFLIKHGKITEKLIGQNLMETLHIYTVSCFNNLDNISIQHSQSPMFRG